MKSAPKGTETYFETPKSSMLAAQPANSAVVLPRSVTSSATMSQNVT